MLLKMTPCAIGFKFFQKRDRIHTARAVSGSVVLIILIAFMTGPLPNETRETVFILLLKPYLSLEEALAVSLVYYGVTLVGSAAGGIAIAVRGWPTLTSRDGPH